MSTTSHTVVIGNSGDIPIDPGYYTPEVRVDVLVSEFSSVRIWGQIVNSHQQAFPNALVRLVKVIQNDCERCYENIAHTLSDDNGFYQFEICSDSASCYKILVGSSTTVKEIIVSNKDCPSFAPLCETSYLD